MTRAQKIRKVRRALASLGDTSAEVAASLRRLRIQERNGGNSFDCSERCPIAVFLQDVVGVRTASMGATMACDQNGLLLIVSDAIQDFVSDFDSHTYPDLEAP